MSQAMSTLSRYVVSRRASSFPRGATHLSADPQTPNKIHLKVGYTTKLASHIDQWDKKCRSKENILRSWWPRTIEDDASGEPAPCVRLLKGQVEAGDTGPFSRRLERLVHLELADLEVHAPYLKPGFEPDIQKTKKNDAEEAKENVGSSVALPAAALKRLGHKPCSDCESSSPHFHCSIDF